MRISSVLVAPGVAQDDTCRCLEFKLNAPRTRGCSCISTRADCMHHVHGLSIYVHPCPCRRHRRRSRRRRLRSRGCKPRLLAFFLVFLSFFFTWLTVPFRSLPLQSTIDDGFRPRLFPVPRFGPRVSSQWMETADYVCATFGGSGCISLCATLIRKMNDLVSGSRSYTAALVKRFARFRFTANGLKRIESLTNFWRYK